MLASCYGFGGQGWHGWLLRNRDWLEGSRGSGGRYRLRDFVVGLFLPCIKLKFIKLILSSSSFWVF